MSKNHHHNKQHIHVPLKPVAPKYPRSYFDDAKQDIEVIWTEAEDAFKRIVDMDDRVMQANQAVQFIIDAGALRAKLKALDAQLSGQTTSLNKYYLMAKE
jgi:uncharacterized protein YigE (DUF2233 family)